MQIEVHELCICSLWEPKYLLSPIGKEGHVGLPGGPSLNHLPRDHLLGLDSIPTSLPLLFFFSSQILSSFPYSGTVPVVGLVEAPDNSLINYTGTFRSHLKMPVAVAAKGTSGFCCAALRVFL